MHVPVANFELVFKYLWLGHIAIKFLMLRKYVISIRKSSAFNEG